MSVSFGINTGSPATAELGCRAVTRCAPAAIALTAGQVDYEWRHLLQKLEARNPVLHERWGAINVPNCHPMFRLEPGLIERWERLSTKGSGDT